MATAILQQHCLFEMCHCNDHSCQIENMFKEMQQREKQHSRDALHVQHEEPAKMGDAVTIHLNLVPENGFVPTPLFDTVGKVSFVLGWGNYLPGLHSLVEGMRVGEEISGVSIDAGWGKRRPELMAKVALSKLSLDPSQVFVGTKIYLQGGIEVVVAEIDDEYVVVDGNAPLAGASFSCDLKLISIDTNPLEASSCDSPPVADKNNMRIATFALGCFWGGELKFMRVPGVVGTRVGFTQGTVENPSYEEVCTGNTGHREAIRVVYDSSIVSYEELMHVAMKRLQDTATPYTTTMFQDDEEIYNESQYTPGYYYHSMEQKEAAQKFLESQTQFEIELLPATTFYDAEEKHQQYLLKGGQSAKKETKEVIKCFG
mmetsp:Transcript_28886/g.44409  ORF Transcript_28886/g.44409 Transcript_28886/m.44409 type:complete len:372 (-) Transcript_28886:199-1314(-)|eukprot:CAMPEP_0118696478 /NCGR_PEP_ID=MMETSP0800-20121206/13867_1 /TAXON_ID=210618 ORGANISM="Striatella unipunctata, Strain CCMP2910" /NCGR_SAMPLE_ID=MMETSP0800 /ASSEMBLY_ACC=CAM_ASM_000638 /LENGTH=371 /DNA_ID=CAMNT_0006595591 /DNA_START=38 /DNA_END=1153 /DNA_ORIENTATION=+